MLGIECSQSEGSQRNSRSKLCIFWKGTRTWPLQPLQSIPKFRALSRKPTRCSLTASGSKPLPAKRLPTFNPATGEILANIAEGDREDINRAVQAARAAFETGPWSRISPAGARQADLEARRSDRQAPRRVRAARVARQRQAPPVARAADVPLAVRHFRYYAGWATKIEGNTIPLTMQAANKYHAYTLREPVGVVGQIIPWNFPLLMAAWKLGPALATGCTVVLKPAEQTPLTALRLGELIQEAGFPDGVVNIVPGYGETAGAALAAHPDVDKVAFTGSTEVGKLIVQAAAGNLKKVSLELGGKSPTSFSKTPTSKLPSQARPAPSSSIMANAVAQARACLSRKKSSTK